MGLRWRLGHGSKFDGNNKRVGWITLGLKSFPVRRGEGGGIMRGERGLKKSSDRKKGI
jgi:hypothetical protein